MRVARTFLFAGLALVASAAGAQAPASPSPAPSASPAPPAEPKFEIRRFVVEGATLITPEEIEAATARFVGKNKDFADVQRALEAIERTYSTKGYSAVQVILPEQELEKGEVRFKVVEAKVGKLVIEGNKFFDDANVRNSLPSLAPGAPPNINRIAANLRVANENAAKQTTVLLRGGSEEGLVDAVVRVTDEPPTKFSITLDNTGTAQSGIFRTGFGFQHANMFNRDHVLSAQYITAPHNPDNPHAIKLMPDRNVTIFGIAYRVPLYESGNSLDFSAGYSNVNSGTVTLAGTGFNVSGSGTIFGMRWNINMPKWGDLEQRFSAGYDWRAYQAIVRTTTAPTAPSLVPDTTVHPISGTYVGIYRTAASETAFNVGVFQNLPGGNDGNQPAFEAARFGANARYMLYRYGLNTNYAFANDWQMRFAYNSQVSRNKLISGEQFGIGGADSVRGFLEREVQNDNGFRSTLEFYSPDFAPKVGFPGARARGVFFYDVGSVWRNEPLPTEVSRQGIGSVGMGLRFSRGLNLAFRMDYAVVVDQGGSQGRGDGRVHASFTYIF